MRDLSQKFSYEARHFALSAGVLGKGSGVVVVVLPLGTAPRWQRKEPTT